ncbi:MAG TPA: CoA transferase, partial [Caulobacterales bacterium]|nr:CoA transferase [Caulobacterales bacterium]
RTGPGRPMGAGAGYRTYRCGDGQYLFLGALFAHFFVKTIETMGFDDPSAYPRGADTAMLLELRFLEKSRDEWLDLFRAHDVPAGPVISREEWFASDIVANNKMRVMLDHPELGAVAMPGAPLEFSDTPARVRHVMRDAALDEIKWSKRRRPAAKNAPAADEAPLKGVTVLDLGTVIAGAYATGILASLGANVIKIEPLEGDPFRGAGLGFASYSRGKRGLGLDLKLPAGRDLFLELVRGADIVLDNYRFGVRKRLGVDYAALAGVNPRIISCTINAYGASGPYATIPGFDAVIQAHSGIMHAQGGGDAQEPVMQSITVNDVGSASIAALGVLSALYARERTGRGQEVLTSLANTSVVMQSGEMIEYAGRRPNTPGGRDILGADALHRLYRCADHWIAIACLHPAQFEALCGALGHPEWLTAYADDARDRDGPLAQAIAAALARIGAGEALTNLLQAGVPAVPAIRGEDAYDDPWLWENDYFEVYDSPMHGLVTAPPGFVHWSRSRAHCYERPVPEIGEHTIEVLREFGIPDRRITDLINKRVVFG